MAKLKLPKINLAELREDIESNKRQRRKFLQWYAEQVRQGKA